ncbi:hypothetical protein FRC00_007809 [Tulasnella sp. 408]|nr:hypothetical protein FRC00_007809 [Tulasnella sp. 408]
MLGPTYGPMRASAPSAPSSAHRFSTSSGRAHSTTPHRNRVMNNINKVVIVPSPLYDRYTSYLAYACHKDMVFKTLMNIFGDKVDLDRFHFEWMFLTGRTGNWLMEANIPACLCGIKISKAYDKKSVIFLRLCISAVPYLPRFKELIRSWCAEMGRSAARLLNDEALLEDGEVMHEADPEEEDGEFECDKCGGVFLSQRRSAHLSKCIGSRKRPASARRTTTTTDSVDPASSPECVRCPIKKAKPLVKAPASLTRAASSSSRNIKSRLLSATPAAWTLGESDGEADQLKDYEGTVSKDGGAGDGDEEDKAEDSDGDGDGDDDYEDDVGFEDEDNGFGEGSGGDHRAGW